MRYLLVFLLIGCGSPGQHIEDGGVLSDDGGWARVWCCKKGGIDGGFHQWPTCDGTNHCPQGGFTLCKIVNGWDGVCR